MRLIEPDQFPSEIPALVKELVLPHVVAIYEDNNQIGSAFLTMWHGKQLLVTAKHCLFGEKFNEDPGTRQVHVSRELVPLADVIRGEVHSNETHDVAIMHVEGFEPDRVLPFSALKFGVPAPEGITVAGYLLRDFRRSAPESTLKPKPFSYTGKRKDLGSERVGIEYPNRATTTDTGVRELSPVPRGLSGTLMVSASALLRKEIEVYGVFTEERMEDAYVFGTHVDMLSPLMRAMLEPIPQPPRER